MFTNAADIKSYTLAGHATVTLSSEKTGKHYTYKVSQATDRETGDRKDMWFVGLLTGPDNTSDYSYMGILNGDGFKLTGKSKFAPDAIPVRAFQFFWRHVAADRMAPDLQVQHEGSCGRCGRKLTVPESIDAGIGPECRSKMGLG